MDFLNSCIFDSTGSKMIGVLLCHFDPTDIEGRTELKLYTAQQLQEIYPTLDPRGFQFDEQNVLFSDTVVRRQIGDSLLPYIESECDKLGTEREKDITDFVLHAQRYGAVVLPQYSEGQRFSSDINPILIPIERFKVSSGSFNIYAPYQSDDGFRTCSLLDSSRGDVKEFYIAFKVNNTLTEYASHLTDVDEIKLDGVDCKIYRASIPLLGCNFSVGEAVLNYLAYEVAYCRIGEQVLKVLSPSEKTEDISSEKNEIWDRKPIEANVSIIHEYKKPHLNAILGKFKDTAELTDYLTKYPESQITFSWLQKVYQSPWMKGNPGEDINANIYAAARNLLQECKRMSLKYGLELLYHRYNIYSQWENDFLPPVLRGGGCSGQSIKRTLR